MGRLLAPPSWGLPGPGSHGAQAVCSSCLLSRPTLGRSEDLLGRGWSPPSGRLPPGGEATSRDRPRGLVVAQDPKPG